MALSNLELLLMVEYGRRINARAQFLARNNLTAEQLTDLSDAVDKLQDGTQLVADGCQGILNAIEL